MVGRVHINTLHLLTYHHHDLCIQDTEQLRQYVYSYGDHVDDSASVVAPSGFLKTRESHANRLSRDSLHISAE